MTDLRQAAQQALEAMGTPPQQQAEQVDCPRCGHVCSQRPWVGLTDGDWEWVADKKETSLDTFAHGAAWAADQLKEKNT